MAQIPSMVANTADPSANQIVLDQYFTDPFLPGTLATFSTTEGQVQVALSDAATPQTVANFLRYVQNGEYSDTIIHRSIDLNTDLGGSPDAPGTIIQGGGYTVSNSVLIPVPANSPVPDEYAGETWKNTRGTLAMAKPVEANSATSQWYFNVSDNTNLDTPTVDDNGNPTAYTVFGNVLSGLNVLSTIAALPTAGFGGILDMAPVTGLTEQQVQGGSQVESDNLIYLDGITTEPGTSYTVTSNNENLVEPIVNKGILTFSYPSTQSGTAIITITGNNLDGTSATTAMDVTVLNPAQTTDPLAVNDTGTTTINTPVSLNVLANDTTPVGTINPASVVVQSQGAHGNAVANSDGTILYTPSAGYIGSDSFTYKVANSGGGESNSATVTLTVSGDPPTAVDEDEYVIGSTNAVVVNIPQLESGVSATGIVDDTVRVVTPPQNGNAFAASDGTISYTPPSGFVGTIAYTYSFNDTVGQSSSIGTVRVHVGVAVNSAANQNQSLTYTDSAGLLLPSKSARVKQTFISPGGGRDGNHQ